MLLWICVAVWCHWKTYSTQVDSIVAMKLVDFNL